MFQFLKRRNNTVKLFAPVDGEVVNISEVKDPVFSGKLLGECIAIKPKWNIVVSPVQGKLSFVMESRHAFGIQLENGMEVLVHIGIDTVQLHGSGFEILAKVDETVNVGQPIVRFNMQYIQEQGYDLTTILIVSNSAEFETPSCITKGNVSAGRTVVMSF